MKRKTALIISILLLILSIAIFIFLLKTFTEYSPIGLLLIGIFVLAIVYFI